jgi:hypothetical protein
MDRSVVSLAQSSVAGIAEQLERGAILTFQPCPFVLPQREELALLCAQRLEPLQSCMSYDGRSSRVRGNVPQASADAARLRAALAQCAERATCWLAGLTPQYAAAWELDGVAFHPEEEATRKLRPGARNDLLHVDTSFSGPTHGRRLLRLFVNLHPTDPRVWLTSLSFAELLKRYGPEVGLPAVNQKPWWRPLRHGLLRLFQGSREHETRYDDFLRRLHDFVTQHDPFQERSPKKCWRFPPGGAWLAFTDGLSHAELRGRFVLEHSFFISRDSLVCPELAPRSIFERACATTDQTRAA